MGSKAPGSGSARVTDMANAGRRGKTCRVLRVSGVTSPGWMVSDDPVAEAAMRATQHLLANFGESGFHPDGRFEVARDAVREVIRQAREQGVPPGLLDAYDEEVKAIDAPKPKLTAGVAGRWVAAADENGIRLHDVADPNQWTEITFKQTKAAAYAVAAKVWDEVKAAATLHEAASALRAAGARLHGYCGMD